MRVRKHFIQWLAVTILYWMVAYTIANLTSYIYCVFVSLSQVSGMLDFMDLILAYFFIVFFI